MASEIVLWCLVAASILTALAVLYCILTLQYLITAISNLMNAIETMGTTANLLKPKNRDMFSGGSPNVRKPGA